MTKDDRNRTVVFSSVKVQHVPWFLRKIFSSEKWKVSVKWTQDDSVGVDTQTHKPHAQVRAQSWIHATHIPTSV